MKLNLKKMSKGGNVNSLVFIICFFIASSFCLFSYFQDADYSKSAEQLVMEGKTLDTSRSVDSSKPLGLEILNIAYSKENLKNDELFGLYVQVGSEYVCLFVDEGDSTLRNLVYYLEQAPMKQPEYLKVAAYEVDPDLRSYINELNAQGENSGIVVNSSVYLYYSPFVFSEEMEDRGTLLIVGIIFLIVALIGGAVFLVSRSKSQKAYFQVIREYPELEGNVEIMVNNGYFDDKIRVAVYKNHVITMFNKMMAVDLREIRSYNTRIKDAYYSGICIDRIYYIHFILKNNDVIKAQLKKYKKETDTRLEAVYKAMERRLREIYDVGMENTQEQPYLYEEHIDSDVRIKHEETKMESVPDMFEDVSDVDNVSDTMVDISGVENGSVEESIEERNDVTRYEINGDL